MTPLTKPITRRCIKPLNGSFGIDNGKRLVVTLVPGKKDVEDMITIRVEKTRTSWSMTIADVFRAMVLKRIFYK